MDFVQIIDKLRDVFQAANTVVETYADEGSDGSDIGEAIDYLREALELIKDEDAK